MAAVLVIGAGIVAVAVVRPANAPGPPAGMTATSQPIAAMPSASPTPATTERATNEETRVPGAASATSEPSPPPAPVAVLAGAGDIADCGSTGDEATAALLDAIGGTVMALGDTVYPSGTPADFANCYAPSWGRHLARTRPAPGNHDYETPGAAGYFQYFGAAAGTPGEGWYSYEAGEWHVIVLNSICAAVGGCHAGSTQEAWLRADLAAHPAACTLAYWHNPRFSSAEHGSDATYDAFWRALHAGGAEIVLSAHDHVYERFAPQDPDGRADSRGIRQFTVGTGGRSLYAFRGIVANSEKRDNTTFGVLKLTLRSDAYAWEFLPTVAGGFTDAGSSTCHE